MGIWQSVVINCQKNATISRSNSIPCSASDFLVLDNNCGLLGLLSVPNFADSDYPLHYFQNISVAVDGNIYNKKILCRELNLDKDAGIGIIVISLYSKYGADGFYRLNGAFSFILYDGGKQTTLLYRSFLTGFPLYFVAKNNLLSVSTNPIDILYRPDVSDCLNMEQMSANFSLYPSGWTDTVFLDLNEVEHGEIVVISSGGVSSKKRSLNEILISPKYGTESEIIKTYQHLVETAVVKNMQSSKKYGIMLSSGMDSSTLAFFASKKLKKEGLKLHAYSWSLPGYQMADETENIKELCSEFDIELKLFNAEKFAPFSEIDNLQLQPDIPFTNLFSPMISELYRRASKDGMEILFNGHYGDNLFPPTDDLFVDILKDKRFDLFFPTLKSVLARVGYRNAIRDSPFIRRFIRYLLPFYKSKRPAFSPSEWLSNEAKESRRIAWENQNREIEAGYGSFTNALTKHSTSSGMGRYSIGKFGIERIEPYTDVDLLNYTLRLPAYMSYRNGQMKYIAREAMRGLLPEYIRTQARVGLLNQFARDGFMKRKDEIRERLFDKREPWKVYIDEGWMEKKFKKNAELEDKELLVIWMSLHMAPWTKAIKPGGLLYEGNTIWSNSMDVNQ